MKATPKMLQALENLRVEKKFVKRNLYPGAPNEEVRLRCESNVNGFLNDVLTLLARNASKEEIFSRARTMLDLFSKEDTEEYERADDYVGELMCSIGLEDWKNFI